MKLRWGFLPALIAAPLLADAFAPQFRRLRHSVVPFVSVAWETDDFGMDTNVDSSENHGTSSGAAESNPYASSIANALSSGDLSRARILFDESREKVDISWQSAILKAHASEHFANTTAAHEAEKWLDQGETMKGSKNSNVILYNLVLKAWKVSNDPSAPQRAEALIDRMDAMNFPNTVSYSTLIALHANNGSAKEARQVLAKMEVRGVPADSQTLNTVILACVRGNDMEGAEAILDEMERAYSRGDPHISPDQFSYAIIMNGWSKKHCPDSMRRAEEIFQRQHEMYIKQNNRNAKPKLLSYVTLISDMSMSGMPDRAEATLRKMCELYKQGNKNCPQPSEQMVTMIINGWKKSNFRDAAERSERLLNWMIDEYQSDSNSPLRPNKFIFSSVISAWARSKKLGKAHRARTVLNRMKELYHQGVIESPPNAHCYTSVLSACAFSNCRYVGERSTAMEVAETTYKELLQSEHCSPNQVSYDSMITTLIHAAEANEERTKKVIKVFKECAEAGFVDKHILRRVQKVLPKKTMEELVGANVSKSNGDIDVAKLPAEWSCNIRRNEKKKSFATSNRKR